MLLLGTRMPQTMGVRRNFCRWGGQSQHFAYLFQFVGDATMGAILLQNVGGQLGVKPI